MRIAVVAALALVLTATRAWALDEALYTGILQRHTVAVADIASTRVDYGALRESADWKALLESLRTSDLAGLESREETLAFWINAYNILTIDMVRRHYPVDSIRSIGGPLVPVWKKPAGEIARRIYTLDQIEHEILRPLGEPRVHGAIVCAALSCPPLRREPYRAADLDAQLEDNVRRWLADPRKGVRIERHHGTLQLSPILDWFAADFGGDVLKFVGRHARGEDAAWIRHHRATLHVRYFDYDWRLNDTKELHAGTSAAAIAR